MVPSWPLSIPTSRAIPKDENDPYFIGSTMVLEGRATFLVVCVGLNSHNGRIFDLLSREERQKTPLQEKLEKLAEKIGEMGIFAASLTFIALVVGWIYRDFIKLGIGWTWHELTEPLSYFIVSITIIACAVPEGLPLAVTISLAYSMRKMMDDNNFVRHLNACETMGSASVICTDKTGTLTKNQMNVEKVIIGTAVTATEDLNVDSQYVEGLKHSIAVNSHAVISNGKEIGSQTECALVRLVKLFNGNVVDIRKASGIVHCFQFDRVRKMMSTVEQVENRQFIVHVKGAPDVIISLCHKFVDDAGNMYDFTDDIKEAVRQIIDDECAKSFRCLAIAMKTCQMQPETFEDAEKDLILTGVLCIRDSLRNHTIRCIKECQRAGIRVIMITGDHLLTAEAIAKECDILTSETISITGAELRELKAERLTSALSKVSVVARSTPMDKHLIVTSLQKMGEIVAVTGDGTNDVAALTAADVGLAMGRCGTALAKEASDIVVLDDDFRSIVKSVVWGRCVYDNIRRFLQFQLTANVSTLFISFVSAVVIKDTPFKAVQLLWVNMIMDSFGALALATGKPHDYMLDQKPQNKELPLISPYMMCNIVCQAALQIILIGMILAFPGDLEPFSEYHYTFLFNTFVFCQVFNLINARSTEPGEPVSVGLLDTPLFLGIILLISVVQWLLVEVAGTLFRCTPLLLHEWVYSILLASLSLPVGKVVRMVCTQSAVTKFQQRRFEHGVGRFLT